MRRWIAITPQSRSLPQRRPATPSPFAMPRWVTLLPAPTVELRPGSVVRLRAGQRTVWTVRQTLRKVYIA